MSVCSVVNILMMLPPRVLALFLLLCSSIASSDTPVPGNADSDPDPHPVNSTSPYSSSLRIVQSSSKFLRVPNFAVLCQIRGFKDVLHGVSNFCENTKNYVVWCAEGPHGLHDLLGGFSCRYNEICLTMDEDGNVYPPGRFVTFVYARAVCVEQVQTDVAKIRPPKILPSPEKRQREWESNEFYPPIDSKTIWAETVLTLDGPARGDYVFVYRSGKKGKPLNNYTIVSEKVVPKGSKTEDPFSSIFTYEVPKESDLVFTSGIEWPNGFVQPFEISTSWGRS